LVGTGVDFENDKMVEAIVTEPSNTRGALALLQFTDRVTSMARQSVAFVQQTQVSRLLSEWHWILNKMTALGMPDSYMAG
jgi:hypothetical protein